jgi:hypothetical protein
VWRFSKKVPANMEQNALLLILKRSLGILTEMPKLGKLARIIIFKRFAIMDKDVNIFTMK